MRNEENFVNLLDKKKIIVPIIQRDYAQGRLNKKAQAVRERLIDDIIEAIKGDGNRIDFNFIYGVEMNETFYPVDGQQRLTSLYLIYWYLAFANGKQDILTSWNFEYQTRNSAIEFYNFLKDIENSIELYDILKLSENDQKEAKIKNKTWFKTKWLYDSTIMGSIHFLILLSEKLAVYENRWKEFWKKITDSKSAIYFTYLSEKNENNAEVLAAKKYTRMNARGKKLTEFENLKAIIDEIEANEEKESTISYRYDEIYIHSLYNHFKDDKKRLNEIVSEINKESIEWFEKIYNIYCMVYEIDGQNDLYENTMYKISQKRREDKTIGNYLYMLKAVHEILYNTEESRCIYCYNDFDEYKKIAFVIFVSHFWKNDNESKDNYKIKTEWERFDNMLDDLNYIEWKENEQKEIAKIIDGVVKYVKKYNGVDNFFANNDFLVENPFEKVILDDIKCRIKEQQIKSKLLLENVINSYTYFDKIALENRRIGYFLDITDCVDNWENNLNLNICKTNIEKYIKIFEENEFPNEFSNNEAFLKSYAYATYYDLQNNRLKTAIEIDKDCVNNGHKWRGQIYLYWNDDSEHELEDIQIKNLKTTMNLICEFMGDKENTDGIFDEFINYTNEWFTNNGGYEKSWLRIALKNDVEVIDILQEELTLDENGVVATKYNGEIPFILKIYLMKNYYNLKYNKEENKIDIDKVRRKLFWKDNAVLFSEIGDTLTFEPTMDDEKYRHTRNDDWYVSVRNVSKNIDIEYEIQLRFKDEIYVNSKVFSYEYIDDGLEIKIYDIGKENNNQIEINISKALVGREYLEKIKEKEIIWKNEFQAIEESKSDNYDKWVEIERLNSKNSVFEFFNKSLPGEAVLKCKGGQRTSKKWIDEMSIVDLNWIQSTELI